MKHTTKTIEGQCSGAERRPCFSKVGPPNGGCHKGTPIGTSASPVKTPVRTAKHKKHKLKECRVVVEDIFKNLHSHPNTETIQKSNLCDLKLDDICSSDSCSSEIHSIKSSESKTLNSSEDIVNIMDTCGDGKSKGISRCSSARCGFKDRYFVPNFKLKPDCRVVPPIKEAAMPVGASSKTFGFKGLSPAFLKIFSAHWATVLIR